MPIDVNYKYFTGIKYYLKYYFCILTSDLFYAIIYVGNPTKEDIMATLIKEYDAKIDSKKRLSLRDASFDYYHVSSYDDGTLMLSPMLLVSPESNTKKISSEQIKNIVNKLRENAKNNGTSTMTLDDINKVIYGK